jgi:peptidoglycan hydrolase-like protein with peptidoglycan-binding domain
MKLRTAAAAILFALLCAVPARADAIDPGDPVGMGSPRVAAIQIGLRARGLYAGTIDGIRGPLTVAGIRRLQRRARLAADGIVGRRTRRALGRYGRPLVGSRVITVGSVGWDVSQLQFRLAWHGFPSGSLDGAFGPRTARAVRRFQRFAHLSRDGAAGPSTIAALRRPLPRSPFSFALPVSAPVADRFGPRGSRFHAGIDFPAASGTPVRAARSGRVAFAGWDGGGYGKLVLIAHRGGAYTWYAHLSRISVARGRHVVTGSRIGAVGSTGSSTGPHLHFEVRVRGAAVDPLTALR